MEQHTRLDWGEIARQVHGCFDDEASYMGFINLVTRDFDARRRYALGTDQDRVNLIVQFQGKRRSL